MPVGWNADDPRDVPLIADNLRRILREMIAEAAGRSLPTVALAQEWHRAVYAGSKVPVSYFVGEFRDSDPDLPELDGYEVAVGSLPGFPAREVPEALSLFEQALQEAVQILDQLIPPGAPPEEVDQLHSVLTLCAHAHGEWVRIHPFANGNGRTARLWSNWCALRYGLPPFLRLQPRPAGSLYRQAASDSMGGDHRAMTLLCATLLDQELDSASSSPW